MVRRCWVDLCALLLAPEYVATIALEQLAFDGYEVWCGTGLARVHAHAILKDTNMLDLLDGIEELPPVGQRVPPIGVLWIGTPQELRYERIMLRYVLPNRRRPLWLQWSLRLGLYLQGDAT